MGVEEKQNSLTSSESKSKRFGTLMLKSVQRSTDALHLAIQTEECNCLTQLISLFLTRRVTPLHCCALPPV